MLETAKEVVNIDGISRIQEIVFFGRTLSEGRFVAYSTVTVKVPWRLTTEEKGNICLPAPAAQA